MSPVGSTVAVLGTGTMGAPMARNLAASGLSVRAWNRSPDRARPLADDGIDVCLDLAEAVRGAGIVVTMLSDAAAVVAVMQTGGALAAMDPGAVWLQESTIGLEATERCRHLAAEKGVAFVDAPVLGTRGPAERGELVVLASGPEEALDACAAALDAMAKEVLRLGPAGAGTRLKLVVNAWLLSLVEVLAESVAFAFAMGIDPETFFGTIERGGVSLPYVRLKGGAMARQDFPPDFTLRLARKDLGLVLDAAAGARLPLTIVETALQQFDRAIELGHGDEDYASTYFATRPRP
jgi:3-hydroxyisobutyrate dehydrogenase